MSRVPRVMGQGRRSLVRLGGAFTASLMLAGCLGNPLRPGGGTAAHPDAAPLPDKRLETTTIRLGFVPILEAVPLVVGVEKGFFARHGLRVELARQPSWPAARDNVVLGSGYGGFDGGRWQLPMPHRISEGISTGGKKLPMFVVA
jgi:bicarbonate transport system substrate-binding protein